MKKAYKMGSLLLIIALTFIMNCAMTEDATIIGDDLKNPTALTVVATGSVESIVFPQMNGRQIVPAALNGNNLYFYIWGDDRLNAGVTVAPKNIQFYASSGSNGRTGIVDLMDLDESQYELFLVATLQPVSLDSTEMQNREIIMESAVLYATSIVDMRYNHRVSFYLNPYTLDGEGNVRLKVYYYAENPDGSASPLVAPYTNNHGISFGMYDINDDSEVKGKFSEASLSKQSTMQYLSAAEIASLNCVEPAAPNYVWYSVKSGIYNFKAKFYDTVHDKTYIYSDTIIILTNQTTEATVVIGDIIGKYPNQPVDFTAKYADPDTNGSGYYDLEFLWNDTSNNEQYFQIDLMDIPVMRTAAYEAEIDTVTAADGCQMESLINGELKIVPASEGLNIAADTAWTRLQAYLGDSAITTLDYNNVRELTYWVSGSLHSGSENVVIKLPLGKRYLARICAVNDAGESKYTYCGIGRADENDASAVPPVTNAIVPVPYKKYGVGGFVTPKKLPENSRCINRFVINYDFVSDAGGTRGEATYYYTEYTPSGKVSRITSQKANNLTVSTLTGDLHSDVRYYTQLAGGNIVLNPLKVENENILNKATYPYYSLARQGNSWTAWKLDSEFGTTVYETKASEIPAPNQIVSDTTAGQLLGCDSPYTGFGNMNLFATYNAVEVELYSPALDAILDDDIVIFKTKSTRPSITGSDTVQIATINKSNSFYMNTNALKGYNMFYIAVRDGKYDKVELDIETNHGALRGTRLGSKKISLKVPRYVLTTSQPVDWDINFANYCTKDGHLYVPLAAAAAWEEGKYYMLEDDASTAASFTYFELTAVDYASLTMIFRVKGYSPRTPEQPFTFPITINFKEEPTYSITLFEPLDFASNYTKYLKSDGAGGFVANDSATWGAGTVYQEN